MILDHLQHIAAMEKARLAIDGAHQTFQRLRTFRIRAPILEYISQHLLSPRTSGTSSALLLYQLIQRHLCIIDDLHMTDELVITSALIQIIKHLSVSFTKSRVFLLEGALHHLFVFCVLGKVAGCGQT